MRFEKIWKNARRNGRTRELVAMLRKIKGNQRYRRDWRGRMHGSAVYVLNLADVVWRGWRRLAMLGGLTMYEMTWIGRSWGQLAMLRGLARSST